MEYTSDILVLKDLLVISEKHTVYVFIIKLILIQIDL